MSIELKNIEVKQVVSKKNGSPAYIRGALFEQLKPFALFDSGVIKRKEMTIGWHPHSGVATITLPYNAELNHADSQGNHGTIKSRGLQWMASGSGVWHKENYVAEQDHIGILQLWLLLPPEDETAAVRYFNLQPEDIPQIDNVRVLLGEYQGVNAAQTVSHNVSYLHINLAAGQTFNWQVPQGQSRGFAYPLSGSLSINKTSVMAEQLALFKELSPTTSTSTSTSTTTTFSAIAESDCEFVLALVAPWQHDVVSQYGQIHTTKAALNVGSKRIQVLGNELAQQGEIR